MSELARDHQDVDQENQIPEAPVSHVRGKETMEEVEGLGALESAFNTTKWEELQAVTGYDLSNPAELKTFSRNLIQEYGVEDFYEIVADDSLFEGAYKDDINFAQKNPGAAQYGACKVALAMLEQDTTLDDITKQRYKTSLKTSIIRLQKAKQEKEKTKRQIALSAKRAEESRRASVKKRRAAEKFENIRKKKLNKRSNSAPKAPYKRRSKKAKAKVKFRGIR